MRKENIYRAAAMVTIFSVVEKFFGFVYRIVLSRTLGSEGMGIYQVALSVFAVLATIAASGLPLTVSRLITKYRAKNNPKAQNTVVSAALACALLFSLPVFCVLYFGHEAFDFLFSDPRCMSILLVLLPSLAFNSVYSVLRGAMWGNKQFLSYCVIDLIEELCMIGAGIFLVTTMTDVFDGAKRVAFAVVLSYLVSFTLASVCYFLRGGRLNDPRRQLKPLLSSALPLTGMRTASALINSAISLLLPARLIAAGYTNSEAMSLIGVATGMSMPVLSIPATLIGALALVFVPELAENFYKGEHKKLRGNIERAIKVSVLVSCLLIPPMSVLGSDVGVLLFSSEKCGEVIQRSAAMLLPMSIGMITTSILNSLGYEKQTFFIFFAGAAATLLCVWFLPAFLGIYALIAGMAASAVLTAALNLYMIQKKSKEKVRWKKHTLLSCATVLPATVFGQMLRYVLGAAMPALPAAIVCGAVLVCAQGLLLFALDLARPEWAKLLTAKSS